MLVPNAECEVQGTRLLLQVLPSVGPLPLSVGTAPPGGSGESGDMSCMGRGLEWGFGAWCSHLVDGAQG